MKSWNVRSGEVDLQGFADFRKVIEHSGEGDRVEMVHLYKGIHLVSLQ